MAGQGSSPQLHGSSPHSGSSKNVCNFFSFFSCMWHFTTDRAKKHHLCDIHGKKKNLKCQYCGHGSHTPSTLYLHLKSCPKNPHQIPLYCELCTKGPWYTGSKVLEHKRKCNNFVLTSWFTGFKVSSTNVSL